MLARLPHLWRCQRAASAIAQNGLFPGVYFYSNRRSDESGKELQPVSPRAVGINPLELTARLEKVLAKSLTLVDAKFAIPPPPPSLPAPVVDKAPRLGLLKNSLSLDFDDGETTAEPTSSTPPPPTGRSPAATKPSQHQHKASAPKVKATPPKSEGISPAFAAKQDAKATLSLYATKVRQVFSKEMGEAERRKQEQANAVYALKRLADVSVASGHALEPGALVGDERFKHLVGLISEPASLTSHQLVAVLAACAELRLETLQPLMDFIEAVCAQ